MADSISTVSAQIRGAFSSATTTQLEWALNAVNRDLHRELPLRREIVSLTALVVGTGEYALDADIIKVWQALYRQSATDKGSPLELVSLEGLDEQAGWYNDDNGTPEKLYLVDVEGTSTSAASSVVKAGLYPKPDTASTGSPAYPRVEMRVTRCKTLSGTDLLPQAVKDADVYYRGALYYLAPDFAPDDEERLLEAYMAAKRRAGREYRNRLNGVNPSVTPTRNRRSVV